jgi:hypothetical protein
MRLLKSGNKLSRMWWIALGILFVILLAAGALVVSSATTRTGDAVLVGAGDIASCNSPGDEATAKLIDNIAGTVFVAGDDAYERGDPEEFAKCYEPSWGRFKDRTRPAVGNHEYLTANAVPYFAYFGGAAGDPNKGYYSYDLGAWHIIVINSNCARVGGCAAGTPQEQWLRDDLRAHPAACTLAYWHHPRFSSGQHGNTVALEPIWRALYDSGADVVINGHDHDYERFAPQDPIGAADPARGIREFIVGTGGKNHYAIGSPIANSEVRNAVTFGVLKLTLHPTSYDWQFIPEAGKTFTDSGHGECHSARGAPLLNLGTGPTLAPAITTPAPAPTALPGLPFSDDFESGDLSRWTDATGLVVQRQEVADGAYAARATSSGEPAYAWEQLSTAQNELYYFTRFKILNQGANTVYLLRFRTAAGSSMLGLYISNTGKLSYRNDVTDKSVISPTSVSRNEWHELQVHVRVAGATSATEVWFDGSKVDSLSKTEALGVAAIGRIQLGDNASGRSYDVAFDEIKVDTSFIDE